MHFLSETFFEIQGKFLLNISENNVPIFKEVLGHTYLFEEGVNRKNLSQNLKPLAKGKRNTFITEP